MARRIDRPTGLKAHTWLAAVSVVTAFVLFSAPSVLLQTAPASAATSSECKEERDRYGRCEVERDPQPDGPNKPPEEPQPEPEKGDTYVEEKLTSACSSAPPDSDDSRKDADCMATHSCPSNNELRFTVWHRTMTYDGAEWQPGDWRLQGGECRDLGEDDPVITDDDVRREVVKFGLPGATTKLNPPDGNTIVNLDTNFYTEREPAEFPLDVLGQTVQVRATPKEYVWTFGDGTPARTTTTPGHRYWSVPASVDTCYAT